MRLLISTVADDTTGWYLGIWNTPIQYACRPDALQNNGDKPLSRQFIEGIVGGLFVKPVTSDKHSLTTEEGAATDELPNPPLIQDMVALPNPPWEVVENLQMADNIVWQDNPLFGQGDVLNQILEELDGGNNIAEILDDPAAADAALDEIYEGIALLFA